MIDIYIFSYNRPMQLDLTIRSIKKFTPYKKIHVLYKADHDYAKGYDKLLQIYPDVMFKIENNFYLDILDILTGMQSEYILGLTDDECLINPVDLSIISELQDNATHGINLHLFDSYVSNYTASKNNTKLPIFEKIENDKYIKWNWKDNHKNSTWGYPYGVAGNIVRRNTYIDICKKRTFRNPNEMESAHTYLTGFGNKMIAFRECKLINIPVNLVQNVFKNKYGVKFSYTVQDLNKKWLDGYRIKTDNIYNMPITNDFYNEIKFEFEKCQ